MRVCSPGGLWTAALVLGLVNAFIRPLLWLLTLPLTLLTFGLFALVIEACLRAHQSKLYHMGIRSSMWLHAMPRTLRYNYTAGKPACLKRCALFADQPESQRPQAII